MLVVTIGDIIGLGMLAAAILYCVYIFVAGKMIDHRHYAPQKDRPSPEPKKEETKKVESVPLTWKGWLVILLIIAFLLSPLLLFVIK